MKKFGLIGHPLGHTLSPFIHEKLFELSGATAEYKVYDISPEELPGKIDFLKTLDGFNVTIPHKVSVMEYCDEVAGFASICGSVNTVKVENREMVGWNTDAFGFYMGLIASGMDIAMGSKVLLLGCGGAARAAAFELAKVNKLTIAVRETDIETANGLAKELNGNPYMRPVRVVLMSQISGDFALLVNATPVGMYPNVNACPVPKSVIERCENVFDMVYNPYETELVKTAKSLGKNAATGMAMLVCQAALAHEIWYGGDFETDDIIKLIAETSAQL